MKDLWTCSISAQTASAYKSAMTVFVRFVTLCGIVFPAGKLPIVVEDDLMRFVTYCDKFLFLKLATIKLYLSGIRYNYIKAGYNNPLANTDRLNYILRGIEKQQGSVEQNKRFPITFDILCQICTLLKKGISSPFKDLMYTCMSQIGFFVFLPCGEFTVKNDSEAVDALQMKDVVMAEHNSYFSICLKTSKTDPFRKGVVIRIFRNDKLCPVHTMIHFYDRRISQGALPNSPLFTCNAQSTPIHRQKCIESIKHVLRILGHNTIN